MPITHSFTVPGLISAELWRRCSRQVRISPLYSWRYKGQTPEGLTLSPTDLRPINSQLANEYYAGQFTFAQTSVQTMGQSPFLVEPPNPEWFAKLHSFRWLRHMAASNTNLIQATTSTLINDWIRIWGHNLNNQAWTVEITSARLIAWFSHMPTVLQETSPDTHQLVLKSMGKQIRYLKYNFTYAVDGYPKLISAIALAFASLCIAGKEKQIASATSDLDNELKRQILPDGGHISRNPVELVRILYDLIPLRNAYQGLGLLPSAELTDAIDRALSAVRFFSHSNHRLARFNGTGFTAEKQLKNILKFSDSKATISNSAPDSGFERLADNGTVILVDCGGPRGHKTTGHTMAGTLSFELSSGKHRFITNCGMPDNYRQHYAPFARTTAAHSTATIADTSSSQFAGTSNLHKLLPTPFIRSPKNITVERQDTDGWQMTRASHNGYREKFNIIHTRELSLGQNGTVLNGIDYFTTPDNSAPSALPIVIRFHLSPHITASPLSSGQSILILAPDGNAWSLVCHDAPIRLEESIQFSGPGEPRKCQQIAISANPAESGVIRWFMERRTKPDMPRNRKESPDQNTPDLLDKLGL